MKTIVWDVDDVLNNLMQCWFEQAWQPAHPEGELVYSQITENPPHRLLGITLQEYQQSLDRFRGEGFARLAPLPEMLVWFRQHGARFRHVALTSVPLAGAGISAGWVFQHFGQWIRSFSVIPSPRAGDPLVQYDRSKVEFLRWWGRADIIVDDNPATIAAARDLEIRAVLIPRPWNAGRQTIPEALACLGKSVGRPARTRHSAGRPSPRRTNE